ncbi:hypothetical protein K402DRAFT_402625 [Aulographum hederae CBS 113979]|uniref:Tesmin/TSO1-like CXC domain-containing protein n=1 Tax=Aulographum hederae CBS 113979 TaxID=1176131 RepID=A0A6G1H5S6_9PEZI|nr:hypothetical protein K402DRAFT_402625 [Aulographum hederae CBS 113979]
MATVPTVTEVCCCNPDTLRIVNPTERVSPVIAVEVLTSPQEIVSPPEIESICCSCTISCNTSQCECRKWGYRCANDCACSKRQDSSCDNVFDEVLKMLGQPQGRVKLEGCFVGYIIRNLSGDADDGLGPRERSLNAMPKAEQFFNDNPVSGSSNTRSDSNNTGSSFSNPPYSLLFNPCFGNSLVRIQWLEKGTEEWANMNREEKPEHMRALVRFETFREREDRGLWYYSSTRRDGALRTMSRIVGSVMAARTG